MKRCPSSSWRSSSPFSPTIFLPGVPRAYPVQACVTNRVQTVSWHVKTVLKLAAVDRQYGQGEQLLAILKGADFELRAGKLSGSCGTVRYWKINAANIAGLLEHPDGGEVYVNGEACGGLPDDRRTAIRRGDIGFVYQFHHLLPEFTALENIMMPQLISGSEKEAKERAASCWITCGWPSCRSPSPRNFPG